MSVIKKKGDGKKLIGGFEWRFYLCHKKISLVVVWVEEERPVRRLSLNEGDNTRVNFLKWLDLGYILKIKLT